MYALIGRASIIVALLAASMLVIDGFSSVRKGARVDIGRLRAAAYVCLVAFVVAFVALEVALLRDDFSIVYIAEHHARSTGVLFSLATAWAALEGSILLWGLVLAAFVAASARWALHADDDRLGAAAMAIMACVLLFFIGALATFSNPFATLEVAPPDGPGPNPLLRNNVLMAVHPPVLYIGYVGLTVPYAFVMAGLVVGNAGAEGVKRAHRWTTISWTFLSAGILLGAWWSYEVLGWGGYWAWDPVENASIMPWLAATAYLHSSVVQARRGTLRVWNISLIAAAFSLTILGTFLTRSGVIASVHAFSGSSIGPALLAFFAGIVVVTLALLAYRAPELSDRRRLGTVANRDGLFLINNLLLSLVLLVILLGTTYPIIHEALTGEQLSVGRPYFDRLVAPLSVLLLVAMVVGPIIPNGRPTLATVSGLLAMPARVGLGVGALAVLGGLRSAWVLAIVVLAGAVVAVMMREQFQERTRLGSEDSTASPLHILRSRPGYWGGQIAHVGMVILALGVATSGQLAERDIVELSAGEPRTVVGYELTFLGTDDVPTDGKVTTHVRFSASRSGATQEVDARIERYDGQAQAIGVPGVWTSLRGEDLYLSVNSTDVGETVVTVIRYPFIFLIWVGGLLTAAGGLVSFGARRSRERHIEAVEEAVVVH